ncbi:hypothetical protein N7467_009775 [Penicillium canescens]|nr:hypothetical protein N7467_009775 [Penicillium canescens]
MPELIRNGGGGLGDPLTRPAEKVALKVHRKLVTRHGYGVAVNGDFTVNEAETADLWNLMRVERAQLEEIPIYDRGGSLEELRGTCLQETGLEAPIPQWETDIYGPHAGWHT